MTNFDHDDLPPELSELGRRMRDERPQAADDALDRMMPRAQTSTPRRAPRRTLAVSLATMLAMVSVTGVAAAGLFGFNSAFFGSALTNSNKTVGTATSKALKAPARTPITSSSAFGNLAGLTGINIGGGAAPPAAAPPAAAPPAGGLLPGGGLAAGGGVSANFHGNAGNNQYGGRRLICRILRALGLDFVARILGCPNFPFN